MYDKTLTVFSRFRSNNADYWRASVFHGCEFIPDKGKRLSQYGETSEDSGRAIIHGVFNGAGDFYADGKRFVTDASASGTFSANSGELFDFVCVGNAAADGSEIADSGYTNGYYDYINRTASAYAIKGNALYSLIPHIEIRLS